MNVQMLTQKSMEAVQLAQNIAEEHDNQQIEQCHVLLALMMQDGGSVPQLLTKMGVTAESVTAATKDLVSRLPAVTGSGREAGKVYINRDVDAAFVEARARCRQYARRICVCGAHPAGPDYQGKQQHEKAL